MPTSSGVGVRGSADSEGGNLGIMGDAERWMGPPRPGAATTNALRVGAPASAEFHHGAEQRAVTPPWLRLPSVSMGVSAARVDDQGMVPSPSRDFARVQSGNDRKSVRSFKSSEATASTGSVVWTNVRDNDANHRTSVVSGGTVSTRAEEMGLANVRDNDANQRNSVVSGGTVSTQAEEMGLANVRERGWERNDPRPSIRNVASSQVGSMDPITGGMAARGGGARQSDPHRGGGVSLHVVSTATEEASARMASVKAAVSAERKVAPASVVATMHDATQPVAWHAPTEPDGSGMRRPDRNRASWERSSPWDNQPTDMRRTDAQASTAQNAGRRWLPGV